MVNYSWRTQFIALAVGLLVWCPSHPYSACLGDDQDSGDELVITRSEAGRVELGRRWNVILEHWSKKDFRAGAVAAKRAKAGFVIMFGDESLETSAVEIVLSQCQVFDTFLTTDPEGFERDTRAYRKMLSLRDESALVKWAELRISYNNPALKFADNLSSFALRERRIDAIAHSILGNRDRAEKVYSGICENFIRRNLQFHGEYYETTCRLMQVRLEFGEWPGFSDLGQVVRSWPPADEYSLLSFHPVGHGYGLMAEHHLLRGEVEAFEGCMDKVEELAGYCLGVGKIHFALLRAIHHLDERSDVLEAGHWLGQALSERVEPADHFDLYWMWRLRAAAKMVEVMCARKQAGLAQDQLKLVKEQVKKSFGDRPLMGVSLPGLESDVAYLNGRFDEAVKLAEQGVEETEAFYGEASYHLAEPLVRLARCQARLGQKDQATVALKRADTITRKALGDRALVLRKVNAVAEEFELSIQE